MPRLKTLTTLLGTAAMAAAIAANPAEAALVTQATVTGANQSFTVDYVCKANENCREDGNLNTASVDLVAQTRWRVLDYQTFNGSTPDRISFEVFIENKTVGDHVDNRITSFGVKILNPNADGFANVINYHIDPAPVHPQKDPTWELFAQNFAGFQQVDLVVDDTATGKSGVFQGQTDQVDFDLLFASGALDPDGLTLEIFPIFFQGVGQNGAGSNQFAGHVTIDPDLPGIVPEPASAALLGFGLLGLGYALRRRKLAA